MSETLGSLCDKLTVVKLKQYHTGNQKRLQSLAVQEKQLQDEINEFIEAAMSGRIPLQRLTFAANKVYRREGNMISDITGSIGEVFSKLTQVNCDLWHEQENVYEFEKVPPDKKDKVVKQLALLNLDRNQCIGRIDDQFQTLVAQYRDADKTR
jgi:ribosomal protein L44E